MEWLLGLPAGAWFGIFALVVFLGAVALFVATAEPPYRGLHTPWNPPVQRRHRAEDLHSPTIKLTRGRPHHVEDPKRRRPPTR